MHYENFKEFYKLSASNWVQWHPNYIPKTFYKNFGISALHGYVGSFHDFPDFLEFYNR